MENDNRPNDYAAKFLADMEAKYAALGAAIASVRAVLNLGALGNVGSPSEAVPSQPPSGPAVSLPRAAFLGKVATEAIRIYLAAIRKKQTNKEISAALKAGGLESTGNFDNYITNGLFRLKQDGTVLRFDDGWGLAEWYPESFRSRVTEKAATTSGAKKKAKKKASTRKEKIPGALGLEKRILVYLGPHTNRVVPAKEIADELGVNLGAVNLSLGKMTVKGTVLKWDGGYQLPNANVQEMPKAG